MNDAHRDPVTPADRRDRRPRVPRIAPRAARRAIAIALLLTASVAATGCGAQRKAATTGIADAQVAFAGISARADDLMPDEAKSVRDALAQAKDDLDRGDYRATVLATKSLRNRIDEMENRLLDKQAELESAWTKLASSVPATLERLDRAYGPAARPARGVRHAAFANDQRELQSLLDLWNEAQSAKQDGRLAEAVTKAGDVKYRALRLLDGTSTGS